MLTGVFRDRARLHRDAGLTAHQALAQLMSHKLLAPYRPGRQCEIGPFVVDYVFKRHGLIVELEPRDRTAASRSGARTAFLNEMGYSVLSVARRELHSRPQRVLAQIVAALRR